VHRVLRPSLREVHRVLRPGGRLLILQPNIRYAYREYWDFLDHHVALSHVSMVEALALSGFTATEVRPRFLPFTTKSALPQWPILVRLYLRLPPAQWLLGKQMFIAAEKR
jgi:SAM-dependent methyltransferase